MSFKSVWNTCVILSATLPGLAFAQATETQSSASRIYYPSDYSDVLSLQKIAPISKRDPAQTIMSEIKSHPGASPTAFAPSHVPDKPAETHHTHVKPSPPAASTIPPVTVALTPAMTGSAPTAPVVKAPVSPSAAHAPVLPAAALAKHTQTELQNAMTPVATAPVVTKTDIVWDAPVAPLPARNAAAIEPAHTPPATPAVASADVDTASRSSSGVSAKEKLGSINDWNTTALTPVASAAKANASRDAGANDLQISLLKKIEILENEKENLRKKLNQIDPGGVGPVYQCAAETLTIHTLEGQVAFLTQENQSLKQKNQELNSIPKLPSDTLDNLPDVNSERHNTPDTIQGQ